MAQYTVPKRIVHQQFLITAYGAQVTDCGVTLNIALLKGVEPVIRQTSDRLSTIEYARCNKRTAAWLWVNLKSGAAVNRSADTERCTLP